MARDQTLAASWTQRLNPRQPGNEFWHLIHRGIGLGCFVCEMSERRFELTESLVPILQPGFDGLEHLTDKMSEQPGV
jgi:hypothetical protein